MLQRDFGHIVLQTIMNAKPEKLVQEKKRKREENDEEERANKKPKIEDTKVEIPAAETTAETKPAETTPSTGEEAKPASLSTEQPTTESTPSDTSAPKTEDVKMTETKPEAHEEHHEPEKRLNYNIKFAFEFFDRNRTGYLKSEDVETMFHSLGVHVSKNQMHSLLAHLLDSKHRLFYKNLMYVEEHESANNTHEVHHEPQHETMDLNA
jgi:hypothetical protein